MTEIIARREFSPLYIWLDIAFLLLFSALLIWKKKYMTVLVGALAGILYMIVDFGIFHLVCHSRSISDGHSLFWVLLWMSVSYGFTNFAWIWLWLSKDDRLFEWSFLILLWWFACPQLSKTFTPAGTANIVIQRTTGEYHGYMAAILLFGYLALNIRSVAEGPHGAREHTVAARLRHTCSVRLGSRAAHRRHPLGGLCDARR